MTDRTTRDENASEGELLRNQIAQTFNEAWAEHYDVPLYGSPAPIDFAQADAILARFDVRLREPQAEPNIARFEAMMRWLVDSGDMTPMAVRQLRAVLVAEVPDHPESVLDEAAGE